MNLPKSWCIRYYEQPEFSKVFDYLHEKTGVTFKGVRGLFYGIDLKDNANVGETFFRYLRGGNTGEIQEFEKLFDVELTLENFLLIINDKENE